VTRMLPCKTNGALHASLCMRAGPCADKCTVRQMVFLDVYYTSEATGLTQGLVIRLTRKQAMYAALSLTMASVRALLRI
jgi:hypothetical protein